MFELIASLHALIILCDFQPVKTKNLWIQWIVLKFHWDFFSLSNLVAKKVIIQLVWIKWTFTFQKIMFFYHLQRISGAIYPISNVFYNSDVKCTTITIYSRAAHFKAITICHVSYRTQKLCWLTIILRTRSWEYT